MHQSPLKKRSTAVALALAWLALPPAIAISAETGVSAKPAKGEETAEQAESGKHPAQTQLAASSPSAGKAAGAKPSQTQKDSASLTPTLDASSWDINFPGGLALVPLPAEVAEADIFLDNRPILKVGVGENLVALVGLKAETSPGQSRLVARLDNGQEQDLPFKIIDRDYPTVNFTYPYKYRSFDEPTLERINIEKKILGKHKRTFSGATPDLDFIWPATGRLSSHFGNRRVFQNRTTIHKGLDIANVIGTKVRATSAGVVLTASDYYFTGNTVLLDHGSGVLSLYSHLNDFIVEDGQSVAKGQVLGHIGNTGRSTGPHLHFSIGFNGVWVDPYILLPPLQTAQR